MNASNVWGEGNSAGVFMQFQDRVQVLVRVAGRKWDANVTRFGMMSEERKYIPVGLHDSSHNMRLCHYGDMFCTCSGHGMTRVGQVSGRWSTL